ncbi:hypothetical protein [Actinomadura rudentiformis]|uniref:Uncharacterized protein n=1 Tax=Actinomadura rudentiformis TaxID=359158 RepID=A0A6H9Y867_9ACTN|nr:hypothetical protein [Actinomadura rudentiformis]KAB2339306.1 hypothetical protein F8566_48230 [Actinomadura rudentiformis]
MVIDDLATGDHFSVPLNDGRGEVELPAGRYSLYVNVRTPEAGEVSTTLVFDPQVHITQAAEVVLDARRGKPPVTTDRPDAGMREGYLVITQKVADEDLVSAFEMTRRYYVAAAGSAPGLVLNAVAMFTKGGDETGSPYVYNLAFSRSGSIGDDLAFHARTRDLATAQVNHASPGRPACGGALAGADLPAAGLSISRYSGIGALPATRTEYFSPGYSWERSFGVTTRDCDFSPGNTDTFHHRAGQLARGDRHTWAWNTAPFGPAAADGGVRRGDELAVTMPMLTDAEPGHQGGSFAHASGRTTLTRDGVLAGTSEVPGEIHAEVPPERATYQVRTQVQRNTPWSDLSTAQDVTWTFSSERADEAALPLLAVRYYGMRLDEHNRAKAGARNDFTVNVEHPTGATIGAIRKLTLRASYDDGKTWQPVNLTKQNGRWIASLQHPNNGEHVSLHATAKDDRGNAVDQTLIRAYGLTP